MLHNIPYLPVKCKLSKFQAAISKQWSLHQIPDKPSIINI